LVAQQPKTNLTSSQERAFKPPLWSAFAAAADQIACQFLTVEKDWTHFNPGAKVSL